MFSSKGFLEELVRSNLSASPLMKPLLTPGGFKLVYLSLDIAG